MKPIEVSRRSLLAGGAAGAALAALKPGEAAAQHEHHHPVPAAFELEEMTLLDLQAGLKSGRFTSRSLAESYLGRIVELDGKLKSVIEVNPEALAIADALDRERQERGPRGPLHGIPVLIKDNLDTGDRMQTTAGSLALAGSIAARDAFVAAQLRAAGAVILGKTNLSEWANFRSTHSSSGWSSRGGQCRNPYALNRSPSGSSSGTGAAVSANLCAAGVGTETDGSIVSPSAACSLVGIKPTLGLVSRSGIIPIAHSQDTAGPMARCVADAAVLLGAMTGIDPADPATAASQGKSAADYSQFLDLNGLRGARIGVARKRFFGYNPAADKLTEDAVAAMKEAGAVIVDPADIETAGDFDESEFEVLLYEFKADLNRYLAGLGPGVAARSLKDLIAWNASHRDTAMPYFGQEIFEMAEAKGPLTDKAYQKALEKNHKLSRKEGIDATLAKHKLDAIVAPTQAAPWLIDLVNGDWYSGGSTSPAAVAGYPTITVPAGYVRGLPVGISFVGAAWSEAKLIRLAYAFEQATKVRKPPRLRETAEL